MTTDLVTLHTELRRAHTMAARALAAVGKASKDPRHQAASMEGLDLLHAVMGRAEAGVLAELDGPDGEVQPAPADRTGRVNPEAIAREVTILIGTDSVDGIARRLGLGRDRLYVVLRRAGREDLADRLMAQFKDEAAVTRRSRKV